MKATGAFNQALKEHFGAECGAYTAITAEEIRKQTFNVKAVIRELLISKIGKSGIPSHGASSSTMTFMLAPDLAKKFGSSKDISCKFSKPNSDEMTIYFAGQSFIRKSSLTPGDYWCIFFKAGDSRPWFGFLNASVMNLIQQSFSGEVTIEPDECLEGMTKEIEALTYNYCVEDLKIIATDAPSYAELLSEPSSNDRIVSRVVLSKDLKRILDNKKIKGMRGEEIVVKVEKEKLLSLGRLDLAARVSWKSKDVDGLGYDIESYETDQDGKNERKIFIEVKSTSGNEFTPFFVSSNEIDVSKEKGNDYFIYRVYNLMPDSDIVNYYRVFGNIDDKFKLIPQSYMAVTK